MSREIEITGMQLTNALRALDVNFIMGGQSTQETLHKQPDRLITALAESGESRLRLALIPLFLEHHEFALHVRTVVKNLTQPPDLHFNAITLPQSGSVRNTDKTIRCQIIFHENWACSLWMIPMKTCALWQNVTRS